MTDYITEQEYLNYQKSERQPGNEIVQAAISAASRLVEGHTGRVFTSSTLTRYYSPCSDTPWTLRIDDLATATALTVKIDTARDASYATTLTIATQFVLGPINQTSGGLAGWPYNEVIGRGMLTFPIRYYPWQPETVQVHGAFGWAAVPEPVKQATKILAAQYVKMGEAPFGVAGFGEFGIVRVRDIPQASTLLAPYRIDASYGIG